MLALLILLAVFAAFVVLLVGGIKGFHRLGRGERESFLVKATPAIGVLDALLFLGTVREARWFAIAPLAIHAGAFALGRRARRVGR
jgi:hypothetical protein